VPIANPPHGYRRESTRADGKLLKLRNTDGYLGMDRTQERPTAGKTAGKFCSRYVLLGKQSAPDWISGVRISNSRDPRSRHLDSQLFHFPDSRHTRSFYQRVAVLYHHARGNP
jgi:hypothetical protein